jgi:hypothetical protein
MGIFLEYKKELKSNFDFVNKHNNSFIDYENNYVTDGNVFFYLNKKHGSFKKIGVLQVKPFIEWLKIYNTYQAWNNETAQKYNKIGILFENITSLKSNKTFDEYFNKLVTEMYNVSNRFRPGAITGNELLDDPDFIAYYQSINIDKYKNDPNYYYDAATKTYKKYTLSQMLSIKANTPITHIVK